MTKKTKSPGSTSRSTTSNASPDLDLTKDWSHLDPEARREAEKYDNPIPSRELILRLLESRGAPATRAQLQQEFGLSDEDSIEALRRRLRAMERDGLVRRTVYPVVPPKVEYALTDLGHSLGEAFCGVWHWAEAHLAAVEAARSAFDARA